MTGDKTTRQILLTPGPLTTSDTVRAAMMKDWGSRDTAFIQMTANIRERLCALAGGTGSHECVLVQGSGTFAVEATIGTLLPRNDGKCLVLVNGAYGKRIARICTYLGRDHLVHETPEDTLPDPEDIARILADDPAITHVAVIHCETTSGIMNPVEEIARVVARAGRALIIDAMSTFGAIPLDLANIEAQAIVASANKCLEGCPGVGYAIIEQNALAAAEGNAPSLSLDLHDQHAYMSRTGQWRFTPPTHVLAALSQALDELEQEGGIAARGNRYAVNRNLLLSGLRDMGFQTFLPDNLQAPVIVTVRLPADPDFSFDDLYQTLNAKGIILYPGAITQEKSFRIGCIGRIDQSDMQRALDAIRDWLQSNNLTPDRLAP